MKRFSFFLPLFATALLPSCIKDDIGMGGIDLRNTLPPYVEFTSTSAKSVKQGASTTVAFQMRTGLQQNVTVHYDVTGAVNLPNQTVVIEKDKMSATATINIPANVIVAPATSATATVTLKRAVKADGTELTLGSKNNPASQKVTLNITP